LSVPSETGAMRNGSKLRSASETTPRRHGQNVVRQLAGGVVADNNAELLTETGNLNTVYQRAPNGNFSDAGGKKRPAGA
jgi:hypothetical protein